MKAALIFTVFLATVLAKYKSYNGYKLYQVLPKSEIQINILKMFYYDDSVDFWSQPREIGRNISIMVSPNAQRLFESALHENRVDYSIWIENIESTIAAERQRQVGCPRKTKGTFDSNIYHRYDEIQNYMAQLAENYKDIVSLENIAMTSEGRNLTMIKISKGTANKPIILIDGGIHAREWIAPAQVLYIIKQLVENEHYRKLIENVSWYIIPVVNPDGYEYSHSTERLWRKTRSKGKICYGVDANRNFDFHWMETGATSYECSDTYAGTHAFSEPETAGLQNVVKKYHNITLYLTFHSYGQYILYPWGYTSDYPDNVAQLDDLAFDVEAAISSVRGTRYTIGSSTNVLYAAAGGSDDWIKGVGGVNLTYTIELPGGGYFGFDLPISEISGVVKETWKGILVYYKYIATKYVS